MIEQQQQTPATKVQTGPHRWQKGNKKIEGTGRKKGQRNRMTIIAREAITMVFDELGGKDALLAWAKSSPERLDYFYTKIWLKILPLQVKLSEHSVDVTFSSYEAMRAELRRTGLPIPERLAPPPTTIDITPNKQKQTVDK